MAPPVLRFLLPHLPLPLLLLGGGACTPAVDLDADGYSAAEDCDDTDAAVFPGADEVCNTRDDDCDGLVDNDPVDGERFSLDTDGDGYGQPLSVERACAQTAGLSTLSTDCDDTDASVFPDADEVCNTHDDDCDGLVDEEALDTTLFYVDGDGDGYGNPGQQVAACTLPDGAAAHGDDCDDESAEIFPGAREVWYDGIDQDCDGRDDDIDQDGYGLAEDCDDQDAAIHPDAAEICNDGIDQDCSGGAPECGLTGVVTVSTADAAWTGSSASSRAGDALARAADLDGDGRPELLVGAPYYSTTGYTTAGAVYRVDPGASDGDLDTVAQAMLYSDARDYAGTALDAADLDGDGYDDGIIGAPQASNGGGIYIAEGPWSSSTSLSAAARLLSLTGTYTYAGNAVSTVDDVDGDGLPEVAVGAPYASTAPLYYHGAVYLLFSDGALGSGTTSLAEADRVARGSATYSFYGAVVRGLGDLDADGQGDLAISPQTASGGDGVDIFTDLSAADLAPEDAAISYTGTAVFGRAGDVDGDGYDDLLLAASGEAYLMLWPASAALTSADLRLTSVQASALAVVEGLDGDGVPDLLIGEGTNSILYVVSADARGTQSISSAALARIEDTGRTNLGGTVTAAGDTNADGYDDIAIGAYGAGSGAGAVYLFEGGGL